jgi:transposase InsO family protein
MRLPRASAYRLRQLGSSSKPAPKVKRSSRRLSEVERDKVLELMHSDQFVDTAPAEIYATLLDDDIYHCSVRTMYRLLASCQETRERRDQRVHPPYTKPELLAEKPNECWSWDITRLRGPTKWSYFYLYVIIDIFSRNVVGWMVADCESAALAGRLISDTCDKQNIGPNQLTLHADRGSPMTAKVTAQLLADLGVTKSHSRPHCSNDNPFSEAHFKTMKYRPEFPGRFENLLEAREFCKYFFGWYNEKHRHSGIGMLTPAQVHYGQTKAVVARRAKVLEAAWLKHPERFVRGRPVPQEPPTKVWINKPVEALPTPAVADHPPQPDATTSEPSPQWIAVSEQRGGSPTASESTNT